MTLNELEQVAMTFREAIENTPADERPARLQSFPSNSCGDASLLLGTYLMERGEAPFDYMLGDTAADPWDPEWSSHAWIQRGELVVDITADQFSSGQPKVIVSLDSMWHRELQGCVQHVADFNYYEKNTLNPLGGFYQRLRQQLGD